MAAKRFGYHKPLGGIVPRLREIVSDEQMERMGFQYIVALHEPITDPEGDPLVLASDRTGGGRWLHAFQDDDYPDDSWDSFGAAAFFLPS